MKTKQTIQRLQQRYEMLKAKIAHIGLIQVGTITKRVDRRDSPTSPGGKRDYGPYYQWTFKRSGKTVTKNLTKYQAKEYGKAIANYRNLQKNIIEMRKISLKILHNYE
jgi:hypothetical protein